MGETAKLMLGGGMLLAALGLMAAQRRLPKVDWRAAGKTLAQGAAVGVGLYLVGRVVLALALG